MGCGASLSPPVGTHAARPAELSECRALCRDGMGTSSSSSKELSSELPCVSKVPDSAVISVDDSAPPIHGSSQRTNSKLVGVQFAEVVFDFDPDDPPGWPFLNRAPLHLRKGQSVRILSCEVNSMWAFGELVGHPECQGWFPHTYTTFALEEQLAEDQGALVVAFEEFHPSVIPWPPELPQPLPLVPGQMLRIVIDDLENDEWLWGYAVGQSHTEGFIAKAFTVRISSQRLVKKGGYVIAVQSFYSEELESQWPPEKPPLLSLEAGQIMQLSLEEEPGDEWMFGHLCSRLLWSISEHHEGFFPASHTLPILMDNDDDIEQMLASNALRDAGDDTHEVEFLVDGLVFESSPRCLSDIRHLRPPSPCDSRSTTASLAHLEPLSWKLVETHNFNGQNKAEGNQDETNDIFRLGSRTYALVRAAVAAMNSTSLATHLAMAPTSTNIFANSSRNVLRKKAAIALCKHLDDHTLDEALAKVTRVSMAPEPPFPIKPQESQAPKAINPHPAMHTSPLVETPPVLKAVAPCPQVNLPAVNLAQQDSTSSRSLTPVEACSGFRCMQALCDFDSECGRSFNVGGVTTRPTWLSSCHSERGVFFRRGVFLSFRKGQHIYAMLEDERSGWSWGYLASKPEVQGIFPTCFAAGGSRACQYFPKMNSSSASQSRSVNQTFDNSSCTQREVVLASHQNRSGLVRCEDVQEEEPVSSINSESSTPCCDGSHGDTTLLPVGYNADGFEAADNSLLMTGSTQPESEPIGELVHGELALPQSPPPSSWSRALVVSDKEFVAVVADFDPQSISLPPGHEQARRLEEGRVMCVLHSEDKSGQDWCWGHPLGLQQLFCCFPRSCVEPMIQKLQTDPPRTPEQTLRPHSQSACRGGYLSTRLPPLPASAPSLRR